LSIVNNKGKFALILILIFVLIAAGCSKLTKQDDRSPMYITPVIEGVGFCDEVLNHPEINSASAAIGWCVNNGYDSSAPLTRYLDSLEPDGAKGEVQIGYEMGISLLTLFDKKGDQWEISEKKVQKYLNTISNTDRPVVIYFMFNHFDATSPLAEELSKDYTNLMLLSNGEPPMDNYYGNTVIPFTLLTDESIPVNHYRTAALRYVGEKISQLPQEVKDRIVGFTLAGEVHHLFPDFSNGTGQFENIQVTDYSPRSIEEFRQWLKTKYGTIDNLNKAYETDYGDFSKINPPSKNIHAEALERYTEHYDSYAAGIVTISGWLWDPDSLVEELELYIDGEKIDKVKMGLNRLDVYRALEEVATPNVGYRYDLDYRNIPPGHHNAQIVAKVNGELYLMDQVEFVVVDRSQGTPPPLPEYSVNFKNFDELGLSHWIDHPKPLTALYYNPLARDWSEYRDAQVTNFLNYFWNVAVETGLPADKIYSHQIVPNINSSWNPELFKGESSISKGVPYKIGINLYGGATNSDAIREFLRENEISEYGVPEFHTQQWKSKDSIMAALEAQYRDGARFISPYYVTIVPDKFLRDDSELNIFSIRPDNTQEGSDLLYEAIKEFAQK